MGFAKSACTSTNPRRLDLTEKPQYKIVEACTEKANALDPATNYDSLRRNSLELMPIYEDLNYVLSSLIDWEMEEILAPYIEQDQPKQRAG